MRFFVATDAFGNWPENVVDFVVAKDEADASRLLDARLSFFQMNRMHHPYQLRELTSDAQVMAHLGIGREYVRDVRPGVA